MHSLCFWIWLSTISGIGAVTSLRLMRHFGDPEKVFLASRADYNAVGGLRPDDISRLLNKDLDKANRILADCVAIGCRAITFNDALYPERLRNIYDPPLVLYTRGVMPAIDEEPVVSIVGTRQCTPYGMSFSKSIAYDISKRGVIVATGLAKGIDSAAAQGALEAGGKVIGIIGTGPGIVYPPENKSLFEDVMHHGVLISEYPPKMPAVKSHFPARNRLISGISVGVAVIEAPKRSGALITALRALEQGRDIFALPANVDAPSFTGSNALLRDGAIPLLSSDDIISEYAELFPDKISSYYENLPDDFPSSVNFVPVAGIHSAIKPTVKPTVKPTARPAEVRTVKPTQIKKEIDNITDVDYIDFEQMIVSLDGDEQTVAQIIQDEAMQMDKVILNSGLSAQRVLSAITMLEIKGYVVRTHNRELKLVNGNVGL
ncbi:MAG: DNA-processing protein DprA [Oscillospiraceae bacterium]|nr:DNA-processing protein DprA [Oscillospiraceae bacterium]